MDADNFDKLLGMALEEDLGERGDATSKAVFGPGDSCEAVLVSKDSGILCGAELFSKVFERIDPSIERIILKKDGDALSPGDEIARLRGGTIHILEGERTAINFLAFLSGIATRANKMQTAAAATGRALVIDTRKTLPGYRALSKYAVRIGGAGNHRMGLHDMVLIKDNHQDASGGMAEAVMKARAKWGSSLAVEVEARSVEDVRVALGLDVDWIMLDNMDERACTAALALPRPRRNPPVIFEASGNMDEDRVGRYSALGVDRISVGALTHSVSAFDFSLRIAGGKK